MKIRNYTEEQIDYIIENYNTMNASEIAKNIGKSRENVYFIGHKLGLKKQIHNPWTQEELDFLKEHYIDMTSEEMTKYINHSVDAINTQRDKLNLVRNEVWTKEEIIYLKENFQSMSHEEIGKALGRTTGAITAKCFDLDLYKKELPWTDDEINFVRNNYMEMKTADISKFLNRTMSAIEIKARRMGLKKSPYTCDYHYFENIDTEEKAYWLGFLTADGWISKNQEKNSGITGIELQYSDINHLKKFNKSISGNYKITDRWRECNLRQNGKKHRSCVIKIYSLIMYEDLVNLGFTNQKSYDCKIPKIDKELIRHFMRGYFDGDGRFALTNKSFCVGLLTASSDLSDDLKEVLKSINIHFCEGSYVSEFNTKMYTIDINRKMDKIKFLDYIYKDCNIYLDRKYKKYLKAKERYGTVSHQSLAS